MGGSYSQEDYDRTALQIYERISYQSCLFPDVGIDESLLKYSGSDSNAVLQVDSNKMLKKLQAKSDEKLNKVQQDFSGELLNSVPGYVSSFGSAFGALTSVPNAVGLGALVISLIIEILAIKASTQTSDDTYSLLQRVFGEEKVSSVRDTMSEYLKRHEIYMNNDQQLQVEIKRLEQELSKHLTILRNSLLHDGQMSSRGLKMWVNGAAFHVQMLIHEARLDVQAGRPASDCVHEVKAAINVYLRHLENLLEKYKTFMLNSNMFTTQHIKHNRSIAEFPVVYHYVRNNEIDKCSTINISHFPCRGPKVMTALMNLVYSKHEPISGLKSYFLNIKDNLNSLIHERGSFTLPPAEG